MAGRQAILRIDRIQPLWLQLELHLIFCSPCMECPIRRPSARALHAVQPCATALSYSRQFFFGHIVIMAVVQPPPLSALADAPLSPLGVDSKPATTGRELWKSAPCVVLITRRPGCSKCLALLLCFVSTTRHLQLASTY